MASFNISKFYLSDVEYFCDKRLDNINVYSVVLVTNSVDSDEIITDFCLCMKRYSLVQIIQQIHVDFVRFTFVSCFNCTTFSKHLHTIMHNLSLIYKCPIDLF